MSVPGPRSHFRPRTRAGRTITVAFVVLFVLCMPPVTHTVWNRIEPTLFGLPFLWSVLLVVYVALIGVLVRAFRSGV
ncbi:MAG: hypothetical protein U5R14_03030 [Gemmatimonadota bacterium]|nr:hypothetical protein [Gemmatimonadota bacterium]